MGPQKAPNVQKEQNYRHSACHKHSHLSRWLLLTKNCCLDPQYISTYDIVTEPQVIVQVQVCCIVHSGFVSQKFVQITVNCLYHISDPLVMFINNAWLWMIPSLGISPCQKHLGHEFQQPWQVFPISECSILRYSGGIILMANELPTKKYEFNPYYFVFHNLSLLWWSYV